MSITSVNPLSQAELGAWQSLQSVIRKLEGETRRSLSESAGISDADYFVLVALDEAGEGPLRSSNLADRIGWDRSRLSHHLGRMEKRGLISRAACETDSRGSDLTITQAGVAVLDNARGPFLHVVKDIFARPLGVEGIAQLRTILGLIDASLVAYGERDSSIASA